MAKKPSIVFSCTECGSQSPKWLGRCPECQAWNSFSQESPPSESTAVSGALSEATSSQRLGEIEGRDFTRLRTNLPAFDRILGGGMVEGGVILVGGEPGIGKSTLLLQIAETCEPANPVLYVSGEESPRQIVMRAGRLGVQRENLLLFSQTSVEAIVQEMDSVGPGMVIVDSIQTIHTSASGSSPGSVGQVRDSAGRLLVEAKKRSIPLFLIGHVTKDGAIAGPKTLEHIVDTVLYFEGDRFRHYRLIRAVKNRFGPVNEVAIYEMSGDGLREVADPSRVLIAERSDSPGSSIVATIEGTRPFLVEIQALASTTHFPSPRRMATGFDNNRLALLLAVLEKKGGLGFADKDVYLNVAGGFEIDEPAADLGVIAALASSHRNRSIPEDVVVFGEVGLLGEVRSVGQIEARAKEAQALGFRRVVVPASNAKDLNGQVDCIGVKSVDEVLTILDKLAPAAS